MFRLWAKNFINLIYPLSCIICKIKLHPLSDKPICEKCWDDIEFIAPPFCRICGKNLPACPSICKTGRPAKTQNQAFVCSSCQKSSYFFQTSHSVCSYDGTIKDCIHLFKYKGKLSLVKPLSSLLIDFANSFLDMGKIDMVIPVPLHRKKIRQRQFNQALLLAKPLALAFARQVDNRTLVKVESGPAQASLSKANRINNVKGTFRVKNGRSIKDKSILLIDDVFTTGATVNECAKILKDAGASSVQVLTLARSN